MAVLTASRISLSLVSATGSRNASRRTIMRRSRLLRGGCMMGAGVGCGFDFVACAFVVAGGADGFVLTAGVLVGLMRAATFAHDCGGFPKAVEIVPSIRLLG